jgi:broad specificity phosphatase PhoE
MRQGKWKLIEYLEDSARELYDLESDIGEKEDLAQRFPEQLLSMSDSLHQWQIASGAQGCSENANANRELHRALYVDSDPTRLDASNASAKAVGEQWKEWRKRMNAAVANRQAPLKSAAGEIHLAASKGTVHGKNLRYEPESYKNVLGYWTEVDDWADWEITVPNDGRYEVEVQYGCGVNGGGSVVAIEAESQSLPWTVKDTGHFQKMITENVGVLDLKAGTTRVAARPKSKKGVAILDIRRIVLRPIAN